MVLQVPSDGAPGSVHVAFDGQPLQTATLKDRFGATVTTAYSDCDCSLTCAAVVLRTLPRIRAVPDRCALLACASPSTVSVLLCLMHRNFWSTSRFD